MSNVRSQRQDKRSKHSRVEIWEEPEEPGAPHPPNEQSTHTAAKSKARKTVPEGTALAAINQQMPIFSTWRWGRIKRPEGAGEARHDTEFYEGLRRLVNGAGLIHVLGSRRALTQRRKECLPSTV